MERLNPEVQAEFRDGTFVSSIAAASEDSDQDTFWVRDTHGSCYEFVDMVSRHACLYRHSASVIS